MLGGQESREGKEKLTFSLFLSLLSFTHKQMRERGRGEIIKVEEEKLEV